MMNVRRCLGMILWTPAIEYDMLMWLNRRGGHRKRVNRRRNEHVSNKKVKKRRYTRRKVRVLQRVCDKVVRKRE